MKFPNTNNPIPIPGPPDETTIDDHAGPLRPLFNELGGEHETIPHGLEQHPSTFTGELDSDPRSKHTYPEDPKEVINLMTETATEAESPSKEETLLADEYQMQLHGITGLKARKLPPHPLTPHQLEDLLTKHIGCPPKDYSVYVPIEPDSIDHTAVGEYRNVVEGDIIRFTIDYNRQAITFTLIPTFDESGFAWHSLGPTESALRNISIRGENTTELSELLEADNRSEFLTGLPDRITNAGHFLNRRISPKHPSPTPKGWVTTKCDLDREAGDFLAPRYTATFVHESDIVLVTEPIDNVTTEFLGQPAPTEDGTDYAHPQLHKNKPDDIPDDEDLDTITGDEATNTWDIEFAPAQLEATIKDKYSDPIPPSELYPLMDTISRQLSD